MSIPGDKRVWLNADIVRRKPERPQTGKYACFSQLLKRMQTSNMDAFQTDFA